MSFYISSDEEEEQNEKEQKPVKKELTEEEKRQIEEQKKAQETRDKLHEARMKLYQRRMEHKRALNAIKAQTFMLYFRVLKNFPNKSFTASELWEVLRLFLTDKNSKYRTTDKYIITEEEFYGIFGRYPMTMANNRLYKITFQLKQHPDVEWKQDGRTHKYHYIGVKKVIE